MGLNVMSYMNPDKFSGVTHRHERNARLLRATLRKADGTIVPVMVRNLSERGLGLCYPAEHAGTPENHARHT